MAAISQLQAINEEDGSQQQDQQLSTEEVLETFWQRGMHSRLSNLVEEASIKTGLGIPEVKKWISKKKKRAQRAMDRENGIEPKKREKTPLRKKRGYDLYMSERLNQEDLKSLGKDKRSEKLSIAQQGWRELPDAEKEQWQLKAEALPVTVEGPTQIEKKVSKLEAKCDELWALDVNVTLLIPDKSGSFRIHAPPETKLFWSENEDAPVLQAYADELRLGISQATEAPKNADRLRREIQNLFNTLYEKATGKKRSCNYVEMDAGHLVAHGMPEGVAFKRPGMYNMSEKRSILQHAADIRFEVCEIQTAEVQLTTAEMVTVPTQVSNTRIERTALIDEGNLCVDLEEAQQELQGSILNSTDLDGLVRVQELAGPMEEMNLINEAQMIGAQQVQEGFLVTSAELQNGIVTVHDVEIEAAPMEESGSVDEAKLRESTLAGPWNSDDEVTDLSSCSASEAMKRAELLAKDYEKKTSKKRISKREKSSKKETYMSKLVGKRVKQLWTLEDESKPAKWFNGTVIRSSDGSYNIKFDGEKMLHLLTAAKARQLFKKKTLCFI